jgi:hypothetical protein
MTEAFPKLEGVAILALVWRDLWRERICNADEFDSHRNEFGLFPQAAAPRFSDLDWHVVTLFVEQHPVQSRISFASEVHDLSPLRGEAMLHFWVRTKKNPQNLLAFQYGRKSWRRRMPVVGDWAEPYLGVRWDQVEDLIFALEHSGLYKNAEEVEAVARDAEADFADAGLESAWENVLSAIRASVQP